MDIELATLLHDLRTAIKQDAMEYTNFVRNVERLIEIAQKQDDQIQLLRHGE